MWVQIPANDPYTVYSGWQYGHLSRLDLKTWQRDDITPLALDAGLDSGYPYNWGWTTPILVSQHDPTVLYVGANQLVRMTHRGDDWDVLGPDMTRASREHPAPEVGHTSYHAVFAIAESPRSKDVVWTGSDDGLVWVTRDGGKTWAEVSAAFPKGVPTSGRVAAIAASYHLESRAYLVYDCHHRDDYGPHVYRTEDLGKTWVEIGQGLPRDHGSITIFEDPVDQRLLWVGTASGVYVTLDGGKSWRRFGKNLPNVPVECLAMSFAQRDLVVSTHGRGLWIANVAALEDMTDTLLAEAVHLFPVARAYQYRPRDTYPDWGSRPFVAPNPPRGAVIAYYLKEVQPDGVKLVITTAAGDTIRHLTGPGYPGLQRVTWDLTRDKPRPRELGGPTARDELRPADPGWNEPATQRTGPEVVPGQYIVVFSDGVADPGSVATALVRSLGGTMLHIYTSAIKGFAARLPTGAVDGLRQNPLVAFVEPDEVIRADVTQTMDANGDPWGLDRIDQGALPLSGTDSYTAPRAGVHAYIIDN